MSAPSLHRHFRAVTNHHLKFPRTEVQNYSDPEVIRLIRIEACRMS